VRWSHLGPWEKVKVLLGVLAGAILSAGNLYVGLGFVWWGVMSGGSTGPLMAIIGLIITVAGVFTAYFTYGISRLRAGAVEGVTAAGLTVPGVATAGAIYGTFATGFHGDYPLQAIGLLVGIAVIGTMLRLSFTVTSQ
jgi:hypothetical protein